MYIKDKNIEYNSCWKFISHKGEVTFIKILDIYFDKRYVDIKFDYTTHEGENDSFIKKSILYYMLEPIEPEIFETNYKNHKILKGMTENE